MLYITESASSKRSKGNKAMETLTISTTDTAKLIRKELKTAFAGVKFSVTCDKYAGGASIWVTFPKESGIATESVNAITAKFESMKFDGSTDSTSYITGEIDGVPVQFGAHYIMVQAG
jgi:hypothetical protein